MGQQLQLMLLILVVMIYNIDSTVANQGEMSYDRHKYDSRKYDGNRYETNKYDTNNPDSGIGECRLLNQVQSSMIRILTTHIQYGKSIKTLEMNVESIISDMSKFKRQIMYLETTQAKTNEDVNDLMTLNNASINEILPTESRFNTPVGPLKPPVIEYTNTNPPEDTDIEKRIMDLESSVVSLTLAIKIQNDRIKKMERRQRSQHRLYKKLTVSMATLTKEDNQSQELLEHLIQSQKEINIQVAKRLRHLEEGGETVTPRDSPNSDLSTGCPPDYVRHFMSCYKFANTTANWIDAEKVCQRAHPLSHLVGIETKDEEEFIIKYRNYNAAYWSSAYLWTGGNDMSQEGRWTWVGTGRTLGYTNWRLDEPNNHERNQHCIYFGAGTHSHGWDDWHCYAARLNFVCEITLMG